MLRSATKTERERYALADLQCNKLNKANPCICCPHDPVIHSY